MRVHIDAVGLAVATAGEVRHYGGPAGRVDPDLVGFGAYEVGSAEALYSAASPNQVIKINA